MRKGGSAQAVAQAVAQTGSTAAAGGAGAALGQVSPSPH